MISLVKILWFSMAMPKYQRVRRHKRSSIWKANCTHYIPSNHFRWDNNNPIIFQFYKAKHDSRQLPTVWPLRCTTTSSAVRCLPWATTSSVVGWNSPKSWASWDASCSQRLVQAWGGLSFVNDCISFVETDDHQFEGTESHFLVKMLGKNEDWPVDAFCLFSHSQTRGFRNFRMGKKH